MGAEFVNALFRRELLIKYILSCVNKICLNFATLTISAIPVLVCSSSYVINHLVKSL